MPCRYLEDESPEELGPGDSSSEDEYVLKHWVTADPASLYTASPVPFGLDDISMSLMGWTSSEDALVRWEKARHR